MYCTVYTSSLETVKWGGTPNESSPSKKVNVIRDTLYLNHKFQIYDNNDLILLSIYIKPSNLGKAARCMRNIGLSAKLRIKYTYRQYIRLETRQYTLDIKTKQYALDIRH